LLKNEFIGDKAMMMDGCTNVLIVDDDETIRKSMAAYLEDRGFGILEAENGRVGLEIFRSEKPDIVLIDLRMPEMNGLETLQTISNESPDTPTIIVSGTGVMNDAVEALRRGAWDYVIKPIEDMAVLLHTIEKALDRARLIHENRQYQERLEELVIRRTKQLEQANDMLTQELKARTRAETEVIELNQELERRVIARTEELASVNRELEAFSYSVSHDLRAPLRAISGFSHAVLEDYSDKLDEQAKTYLSRVLDAARRMDALIDDLLCLSRITRSSIHCQPINLGTLAANTAKELRQREPGRRVDFVINKEVNAKGDPNLLQVVLDNLLGNAWKFTSKHHKARIEFGKTTHNGKEVFFVQDDGAGFDMAHADRLFQAFQRMHSDKEFEGNGIGLATVQRIIHRHGGEVWAKGEVEKGATFYFSLPES